jgi:hypothetical protein
MFFYLGAFWANLIFVGESNRIHPHTTLCFQRLPGNRILHMPEGEQCIYVSLPQSSGDRSSVMPIAHETSVFDLD